MQKRIFIFQIYFVKILVVFFCQTDLLILTIQYSTSRNLEFDFMDDVATPTIRVRAQNTTPKGSAKKKTANFASVIDAMKKNKRTN